MDGIPAPVRHKSATAAFDERARERLWGSAGGGAANTSGSAESSPELADLVESFYSDDGDEVGEEAGQVSAGELQRRALRGLVAGEDGDDVGARIREEVETGLRKLGGGVGGTEAGESAVKRRLLWWLKDEGFDAGLCKSRQDAETCKFLSGAEHEYIDVIAGGGRYIVETNLAAEFEIARPTQDYRALLATFPATFVGRAEALRGVVRLMCAAAKESMRERGMHVPPWRRKEYVLGKWFGAYRRVTAERVAVDGWAAEVVAAEARAGGGKCGVEFGWRRELERRRFGLGFVGINL